MYHRICVAHAGHHGRHQLQRRHAHGALRLPARMGELFLSLADVLHYNKGVCLQGDEGACQERAGQT